MLDYDTQDACNTAIEIRSMIEVEKRLPRPVLITALGELLYENADIIIEALLEYGKGEHQ